ncbi:MAG: PASTA domain-containing protein [Thermodesulfovibrionales bacterium]
MNKDLHKFIRYPLYIFAFILLGLIFGYLTFKALSFSRTVDVPDLYGKSPLESNKLLSNKGLYLKIEGEDYDSTIATGNIIRQDVPAGKKVKERRGIKVVISKGSRVKYVPMIANETITNAESMLLQKGLKIARLIMVHSDIVEKDRIIAQRPGTEEQVSDMITVLVSLGPYEYIYHCPDFKGMSLEEATLLIKKLNLKLSTEGSGEMIGSQKPEPGKQIKTGDTIYLKLS